MEACAWARETLRVWVRMCMCRKNKNETHTVVIQACTQTPDGSRGSVRLLPVWSAVTAVGKGN